MLLFIAGLALSVEPSLFTIAMSFVIAGAGLIQPNLLVHLSHAYPADSKRRFMGFCLIYLMANLGMLSSIFLTNWLTVLKWTTFVKLSVPLNGGALLIYFFLHAAYHAMNWRNIELNDRQRVFALVFVPTLVLVTYLVIWMLENQHASYWFLMMSILICFCYIVSIAAKSESERRIGYAAVLALVFLNIAFWTNRGMLDAFYSIIFNHSYLLIRYYDGVNWFSYQMIESLLIIVLLVLLVCGLYLKPGKNRTDTLIWIAGGSTIVTLGSILVCDITIFLPNVMAQFRPILALVGFIIVVIAEIGIGPTTLTLVGKIAPRQSEGLLIGVLQCAVGLSQLISGTMLDSIDWSSHITIVSQDPRLITLAIIISLIGVAALVLFFGLLLPIWKTSQKALAD